MGGIDHLRICQSPVPGKLSEQVFPDSAPRPTYEAVVDRRRRAIDSRAIAPATAALEHMHDAADDAAIVHRFTPRTSVGKCGSIRAHCSSLSQNSFPLMNPSPKRINAPSSKEMG
jgi:hypothetical protein